MDISNFNDIPNLYAYWSATESAITANGNVSEVVSVAGSAHPTSLLNSTDRNVTLGPDNTVGTMPAFQYGQNSNGYLTLDLGAGLDLSTQGYTIALLLHHRGSTTSSTRYVYNGRDPADTSTKSFYAVVSSTDGLRARCWGSANNTLSDGLHNYATAETIIIRAGAGEDNGYVYRDGVVDAGSPFSTDATGSLGTITLGALPGNNDSAHFDCAILVFYDRSIDTGEVADLHGLLAHWRDNNEGPTGTAPSTTFGPVATNDDPSVTGWQWEESPNGTDWANVGTILTDISGATTTTLTVNSAPIEADQTLVRCKAFSAKEPAPDGVVSHSAILTVQGGAPPVTPEGIVFQTDWSNDIGVANGYPDDDTGWDMVAKSNDGTVIGELYDVPWGFWYTTIPGQCEEELWRQTAKFKVQKDEVYGNNCFRYKYGDAGQGADSRQDVNFSLPLGTKYTGLNDFYVRFTIRFPRNNNHNYGGTDYWKWARFSSNCWVPDPGEEQLDVSQNRHNNPASSQSIISWWGEAKFNDRSWKLSTAYPLSQQFPDGYGGAGGLQEQQLSYKDGSVKSNPGQISALDPVRMEEAYNQPPRADGSFVLDVEQVYHTVEFHIKSMTDEASDDGVFEMWFDGVKQIAASDKGYGTEDMPHRDVTLGNQHAATLPDYKRAITYARGAGYNLMEWMGNIFDYWQAWNEYDGGVYIKDFVVSTSRITHDYEAVGSIDNRATTYQQEAPEEVTILTVYPTPQERLVGDDDAGSNSTFQHGFSARSTATCTWYITRDSGGGRENLNLNADWSVNRGGNRGDSSTWNNCIALSREGTGFTLDDNGVIELHISTESHGEVWSDPVRLNVIEASE